MKPVMAVHVLYNGNVIICSLQLVPQPRTFGWTTGVMAVMAVHILYNDNIIICSLLTVPQPHTLSTCVKGPTFYLS